MTHSIFQAFGRISLRRGFTLVEVLIVLLMISILAGIGVNAYLHVVARADRQKAVLVLWELSGALVTYAEAHHDGYTGATVAALRVDLHSAPHYHFQLQSLTEAHFVLIAVAEDVQVRRDLCGRLELTDIDQNVRCMASK